MDRQKTTRDIEVWDLPVRAFHWGLVVAFTAAFLTAGIYGRVHEAAGLTVAALIAFRLLWGFLGTRHARFSDFVSSPVAVIAYVWRLAGGRGERHLGHNPAGGMMIAALIAGCGALAVTGWLQTTPAFFGDSQLHQIHKWIGYATVALIPLHLLGVVISSLAHRENLVKAMFTGRKPLLDHVVTAEDLSAAMGERVRASNVFALVAILAVAGQLLWPQISAQLETNARRAKIVARIEAQRLAAEQQKQLPAEHKAVAVAATPAKPDLTAKPVVAATAKPPTVAIVVPSAADQTYAIRAAAAVLRELERALPAAEPVPAQSVSASIGGDGAMAHQLAGAMAGMVLPGQISEVPESAGSRFARSHKLFVDIVVASVVSDNLAGSAGALMEPPADQGATDAAQSQPEPLVAVLPDESVQDLNDSSAARPAKAAAKPAKVASKVVSKVASPVVASKAFAAKRRVPRVGRGAPLRAIVAKPARPVVARLEPVVRNKVRLVAAVVAVKNKSRLRSAVAKATAKSVVARSVVARATIARSVSAKLLSQRATAFLAPRASVKIAKATIRRRPVRLKVANSNRNKVLLLANLRRNERAKEVQKYPGGGHDGEHGGNSGKGGGGDSGSGSGSGSGGNSGKGGG